MKSAPRSYASPLREEQAAATRRRILDGLSELLDERRADDISMADVAQRARVAERTLYRHFPTRLDLFRALFQQLVGEPDGDALRPGSIDEIIAIVRTRFPRYAAQP